MASCWHPAFTVQCSLSSPLWSFTPQDPWYVPLRCRESSPSDIMHPHGASDLSHLLLECEVVPHVLDKITFLLWHGPQDCGDLIPLSRHGPTMVSSPMMGIQRCALNMCALQMRTWQRDPNYNWSASSTGMLPSCTQISRLHGHIVIVHSVSA